MEEVVKNASPMVAVDILTFRNATRDIDFDVYLRLSEDNVAHVFSRTTGLDYKRLAQYIQKGVKELFIRAEDQPAYKTFISRPAYAVFNDPNTSQERKIATLLNMTEQNLAEIFTKVDADDRTSENTQRVVKSYVDLMLSDPHTLAVILKLVSHGEYLYYHSIAVAIFSMFLAKASGQFNQRTLELVGMGGFLHDIGCSQLPREVTESPTELTQEQWDVMHTHPKVGMKMIEKAKRIPDEVRYIVYQHHERPGGKGYPNGLLWPTIYYPAKVVGLADAFSALISKRPFRPAYTIEQAIGIIQNEPDKFDRDLVKVLTGVFLKNVKKAA